MKTKLIWLMAGFLLGMFVLEISRVLRVKYNEFVLAEDLRTVYFHYLCITDPSLSAVESTSSNLLRVKEFFAKYPLTLCFVKENQEAESHAPIFVVFPAVANQAFGILRDSGSVKAYSPQPSVFLKWLSEMLEQADQNGFMLTESSCRTNLIMVMSKNEFLKKAERSLIPERESGRSSKVVK